MERVRSRRGALTPCSMARVTVGIPRSSIALQTSPTDRWQGVRKV